MTADMTCAHIGSTIFHSFLQLRRRAGQMRALLRVGIEDEALSLPAMVDTANLLADPVSGKPVVLVREGALDGLLSSALLGALRGGLAAVGSLEPAQARRVRLLHAQGAMGEGLLVAIAPDWALLDVGKGGIAVDLLLAPCKLHTGFDECQALLPVELIRGL